MNYRQHNVCPIAPSLERAEQKCGVDEFQIAYFITSALLGIHKRCRQLPIIKMRLIIAVFLSQLLGCSGSKNILEGEWIGRESGLVLDFKSEDRLVLSSIWKDTITPALAYSVSRDTLQVHRNGKQEIFGTIKFLKDDSLVLISKTGDRLQFLKIKDVSPNVNRKDLAAKVQNSSWCLVYGQDSARMDFLSTHRFDDNNQPMEAMVHYYWSSGSSYMDKEVWHIGAYNGRLFMATSLNQMEIIVRQILDVNDNEMVLTSFWLKSNEKDVLRRLENDGRKPIAKLTAKNWQSVDLDTIYTEESGNSYEDVIAPGLLSKKMDFSFKDDSTYLILWDAKVWKKGTWFTTSDQKFIAIDDPRDKNNWIGIRANRDHFVLSKTQRIKGGYGYKLYTLTIRVE
ncbi:MAG TPA: hypothetical protein VD884_00720 [Ohtaekwangia sp.]|nr:hypothetical protein [Ohtaekwangia sp.]